ncbi:MAG TPA: hypothetical protein VFC19_05015 [Candidatus Limnocylindrales bacterium]|nr:hypothetical protein [Candidatus Limnocylindrales bacterium]
MAQDNSFHEYKDKAMPQFESRVSANKMHTVYERELSYDFAAHWHPYVHALTKRLFTKSVRGLQEADTDRLANGSYELEAALKPTFGPTALADLPPDNPFPIKELDFDSDGGYAVYNWELFYHVPMAVAIHLSRNQRFAEAQQWFHYIFDPTIDSPLPAPQRFWQVKPFQTSDIELIEQILVNLAKPTDTDLRQRTIAAIDAWREHPFRPHLVARYRPTAYMFKAVFAYLDNLIDWGDYLFRQDTGETVNEALQIYVLAAYILGPRAQAIPRKGSVRPQTYATLKADLKELGVAATQMESEIPFDIAPHPASGPGDLMATLRSIGSSLYFAVPRNDRLIGYWDTVADRLFKIRNSLNIQGIFRQLALFDPPIDPALLARATAAGLDVASVVSGLNQPLPLVRFSLLVQKALEICQEVKTFGGNLLAAMEKEDSEQLGLLRARHDRLLLEIGESVRYGQWQEAVKAREGLEQSLRNTVERYAYYQMLLGAKQGDIDELELDKLDELDSDALLNKLKYRQSEPGDVGRNRLRMHHATDIDPDAEGAHLNKFEMEELHSLETAHGWQVAAQAIEIGASVAAYVPEFEVAGKPLGVGAGTLFGGKNISKALSLTASAFRIVGDQVSYEAGMAGRVGNYVRRDLEWAFQGNTFAGEIEGTYKQLRAAQIREAVAKREFDNHQKQIGFAAEVEQFLKGEKTGPQRYQKTTTLALYAWMKREVRGLYSQCFQFAFDVARKAELALRHEIGDPNLSFLQFGYTSGKEGLLAGEKLFLDIKRMELAYHELNHREYELTKHLSLRQLDPLALLQLRATGRATVDLPEDLFDMDCPGHYFRRIKNVAVTIPCVVGPYASVNCTLTLLKSSIRKSPQLLDGEYGRDGDDTERFSDHFGVTQGIVTSSGQNDSGLFETNLRDERYLPFEGAGAISQWQLEIPVDLAQFDPDTIADVVLHLRYTAREGGQLLRGAALDRLTTAIAEATAAGTMRLLSVRHDFPTEWAQFTASPVPPNGLVELKLPLREEHYPFWARRLLADDLALLAVKMAATPLDGDEITVSLGATEDTLTEDESLGARAGTVTVPALTPAIGEFKRNLSANDMDDLLLVLTFGSL